jgi:methylated-DNA-protein-cysteine methyltransferase-like protein
MASKKPNTHFYQSVYDITSMIPEGKVSTYGAIADYLGLGSARMVGWALNQCHHQDDFIPAHRVVNRLGELSGRLHFATPTLMQERLESEGLTIDENRIVNFESYFWHPRNLDEL